MLKKQTERIWTYVVLTFPVPDESRHLKEQAQNFRI
jgi:hypothetical protein